MTEKKLIKINWEDICKFFPNTMRSAISKSTIGTTYTHIFIPTDSTIAHFNELKNCVKEWHVTDIHIVVMNNAHITYEIVWDNKYQIELKV